MICKEDIDVLLSIVKPETEQEKHLLECVREDLHNIVGAVERMQRKMKSFKYIRALPVINALQEEKGALIKENEELKKQIHNARYERTRWKNRCKKARDLLKNENWHEELVNKMKGITETLENKLNEIEDLKYQMENVKEYIESVFEEEL